MQKKVDQKWEKNIKIEINMKTRRVFIYISLFIQRRRVHIICYIILIVLLFYF
jgi:hypothetical protein